MVSPANASILPSQYIFNPPPPKKNTLPPTPPPPKKYQRHESSSIYPSRNICNCLILQKIPTTKKIFIYINNLPPPPPKKKTNSMQTHQFQLPPNILQYTVYALPRHLLVPHNSKSYVSIFYLSHKQNTIIIMNYYKTS